MKSFVVAALTVCISAEVLSENSSVVCDTECCSTLDSRPNQTYTFYQNTGHFIGGSEEWAVNTYGYSGTDEGYLNPD